ncbi:hypothetical protein VTN77DRAFT_797 [Rasamsonia byssochlamydoides]|uniref:uncharacterized protein n=1 Tax=Rasamsonia byssochlamydoides TaxID=89139 RepID=UPI00374262CF
MDSKRQKPVLRLHPTSEKSVLGQEDEPHALSSTSVRDHMEDYNEDSLPSSPLSEIDDDILRSLGEEIGIPEGQDSNAHPQETNEPSSLYSELPGPLHTCVHPHHSPFSEANLPPILFRLDPPSDLETGEVLPLREGGKIVKNTEGTPLRDFPFLPRYISVQVPGWLLEYWWRTDPRLTYKDIIARMVGEPEKLPTENTLNMRREREARGPLGLSCWSNCRAQISRAELRRVEGWTPDQISYNTTMDVEYMDPLSLSLSSLSSAMRPMPFRLRSKTLVNDDDAPSPRYYPLDTFLENGQQRHVPSLRLTAVINFFYKLAEQALKEDLESWEVLYAREPAASKHILKTSKKRASNGRMESKRIRRLRIASVERDE